MRKAASAGTILAFGGALLLWAQGPTGRHDHDEHTAKMKRQQVEDLLKADHKKSVEDAEELMKLSEQLKIELEKNDRHILSLKAYKKTEEIEKVAKRIRGRMKRF